MINDIAGEDATSVVEARDSYKGEMVLANEGDIIVPHELPEGPSRLLLVEDAVGNAAIQDYFQLSALRYFVVRLAEAVTAPLSLSESYLSYINRYLDKKS